MLQKSNDFECLCPASDSDASTRSPDLVHIATMPPQILVPRAADRDPGLFPIGFGAVFYRVYYHVLSLYHQCITNCTTVENVLSEAVCITVVLSVYYRPYMIVQC